MDYSKLVESLKKQEANRKCFDCGVVGTTYASLNFGTFVCSQCAGILRGLNYKVKPLGISIFTLNEYEILHKNGNENARNIWMGLYDPYMHEKPNPKNYNDVKQHLIRKYKEKKFFRESKGIHFINKSIEQDIKDPLEFINKCKVKNIDLGPLWTKKKEEPNKNTNNNNQNKNSNENNNNNKNIDLLGGLLEIDQNKNNNENQKINDINDLLGGLHFETDKKIEKLNNMINNSNNENPFINAKKENDLGFDFSSFNNNNQSNNNLQKKEEIKDENFGFDFGGDNTDINNAKGDKNNNILEFNFENDNQKNEITNDFLNFDFSSNNNNNNQNQNININNKNNNDLINFNRENNDIIDFNLENNNQNMNNQNNIKFDDNLGFDFGSQSLTQKKGEEMKDINIEQKNNNNNDNINNNLNFNFEFEKEKNEQNINEPKNINSIFEDPETGKINEMKKKQEMKRNDNFQNLTIALDNQNQIDKINLGNFDFSLNNNIPKNDEQKDKNVSFNFDQIMNIT